MASWQDLVGYIRANYKVADEQPTSVALDFRIGDERSQRVMVFHQTLRSGAEEWIQIESAIGEVDQLALRPLLEEIAEKVCGGLAMLGSLVTYRHSVPLENLDVNEFERPLDLVVTTADVLEQKFVGVDRY